MRKKISKKEQHREREYHLECTYLNFQKTDGDGLLNTARRYPFWYAVFELEKRRGLLAEYSRTETAAENIHLGDIFTISKTTNQKTNEQSNKTTK